jgi:DNA-directed RNA polymerase
MQSYYDTNPRRVKTSINGSLIYLTLKEQTDQICTRKSAQAMAPNTVHSWDASHLVLSVSRAAESGITSFSQIHDSFATVAGDTDEYWHIIRESMVEMYEAGDIVHNLYLELRAQMKPENRDDIPLPPNKGTLDLAQTVESRYSFA